MTFTDLKEVVKIFYKNIGFRAQTLFKEKNT